MGDLGASSTTEYIPVRRKRPNLNILKLFIYRIEYSVLFFMLSYLLYTPLIEQYYYKSYGLRLLQGASFNRSAGEAFCLTEELLTNLSGSNETSKQVQSDANHLVAYGQLVKNILAIITTTLVIGPLTDRFGRKIGIVLPAVGSLLQGVLTIFIIKYDLNPYYFIITNFLNGLSGGFTSLLSSSFAYIADVSTMKYRSLRIGAIEGSIALGGGIGQLVGGLILESVHCNFIPPVLLYLTSNFVVLLYVLFILPESTSAEERRQDNTSIKQQFITYIKGFKMYCGEFSFNKNWNIYVATIAANVASFTIVGTVILSVFFLKTPPFDLSPFKIGIYQSVQSASQGLTNLIIPGVFTVLLSNPDPWLILTAFVCAGVGNLLLGFSNQSWQIYILAILQGAEGIAWAGSRGLASKLIKPEQQSALFSIMASLESLSSMVAASLWPVIFATTLNHNMRSGTAYYILSSIIFIMIPLASSLLLVRVRKQASESENQKINADETDELIINSRNEL